MAQARREARSLAAEWIDTYRRTDDSWEAVYAPADLARVKKALDELDSRLDVGPSLFLRLSRENQDRIAREISPIERAGG